MTVSSKFIASVFFEYDEVNVLQFLMKYKIIILLVPLEATSGPFWTSVYEGSIENGLSVMLLKWQRYSFESGIHISQGFLFFPFDLLRITLVMDAGVIQPCWRNSEAPCSSRLGVLVLWQGTNNSICERVETDKSFTSLRKRKKSSVALAQVQTASNLLNKNKCGEVHLIFVRLLDILCYVALTN